MSNYRGEIKRIYIGLPEGFPKKVVWVQRKFRTNELSHTPGGADVIVEYHTSKVLGYDWVKYPSRYVETIFNREIEDSVKDFRALSRFEKTNLFRKEVKRIFARKYESPKDYETIQFQEIWNHTSEIEPWEALKKYDLVSDR